MICSSPDEKFISAQFGMNTPPPVRDSTNPRLEKFKAFANSFFAAVRANDTVFLKSHIVFPIPTRQFSNNDRSLLGKKYIDAKTFFKKLHKLIPDDLMDRLSEAEYSTSESSPNAFYVTVYSIAGGVESNCSWKFVERADVFYLELFTAEAG